MADMRVRPVGSPLAVRVTMTGTADAADAIKVDGASKCSRRGAEPPPLAELIHFGPLLRLLRPVRFHILGCAVLSAFGTGIGLAPYIAIAEIARVALADAASSSKTEAVWTWISIGILGAVIRLALLWASSRLGHYADAEILHDLRTRIVRHLGIVPLGWFRASGSGVVKKAMTNDLEVMHILIAHALGEIIGATTAVVVATSYLFLVDWRLALVTISVLLLMATFYRIAMRSMPMHIERLLIAESRISAATVEYADGITVVKTFGFGGRILERFAAAVRDHTDAFKAWIDEVKYSTATEKLLASQMSVFAAVMAAGLWLMSKGLADVAALLPFLIVGIGLPTSIIPAVHGSQGLRQGRMAAGHIERLLALKALPESGEPRRPTSNRVEFASVSFSYDGEVNALSEVSATCEPGTVTALVGPSGAGKSTLASLLPRFYDVTDGTIRIGGVDIRNMSAKTLLSSMSLVFQDVMLLRGTVWENIRIGRSDATDDEIRCAAIAAQIHNVIEQLPQGYDTVLDAGGGLSGGERQRLTIARAILSDAPIVVLDEATAALDRDNEIAIQAALAALSAGKTVIVIAHRLHTISNADQILVLDRGRLVECGTHPELLVRGGLYSTMWAAQETARCEK